MVDPRSAELTVTRNRFAGIALLVAICFNYRPSSIERCASSFSPSCETMDNSQN